MEKEKFDAVGHCQQIQSIMVMAMMIVFTSVGVFYLRMCIFNEFLLSQTNENSFFIENREWFSLLGKN